MNTMHGSTGVVVIGGGYAGVMAASRLTRAPDVTVTLINPRPWFVERIRLHQLAAGTHDAAIDYRTVLAGRVRLVVDTVTRNAAAARAHLAGRPVAAVKEFVCKGIVWQLAWEARHPGALKFRARDPDRERQLRAEAPSHT